MTSIENISRAQIADFLPDAIAKAITSYRVYMEGKDSTKAADFKEMHATGKTAIAHIELLLKLARWADLPDTGTLEHNQQMVLAALVEEAESELAGHQEGRIFA